MTVGAGDEPTIEPDDQPSAALAGELAAALDVAATDTTGPALAVAWAELTEGYRAGRATPGDHRLGPDHAAAYAVARAPATAAALAAVLAETGRRLPGWRPGDVLDVGAGLGTASWTAMAALPSLTAGHLVERSTAMIDRGRRLAAGSSSAAVRARTWARGDATVSVGDRHDLVLASYVLSELDRSEAEAAVASWWAATAQVLVVVDTGTPAGAARVLAARDQLLAAGAAVLAPCPAAGPCPKVEPDWCHFSVRLDRSEAHRRLKGATLAFEDEPFSYVVASRLGGEPAAGRVLRHPQVRAGHVRLAVCHDDRETEVVVGKARREPYRWARKAAWGDAVPPAVLPRTDPVES